MSYRQEPETKLHSVTLAHAGKWYGVFDNNDIVHGGSRPVDRAFYMNVKRQIEAQGYVAKVVGPSVRFEQPPKVAV